MDPNRLVAQPRTAARLERAAGLILLALAVLAIVGAAASLITAQSYHADQGEAELVALSKLGAVFFGVVGLLFLAAAAGVLRGATWGRLLGLVLGILFGALFSVGVLSSPAPWDQSANLGIYQASALEWLISLAPAVACWIAVVALIRARYIRGKARPS